MNDLLARVYVGGANMAAGNVKVTSGDSRAPCMGGAVATAHERSVFGMGTGTGVSGTGAGFEGTVAPGRLMDTSPGSAAASAAQPAIENGDLCSNRQHRATPPERSHVPDFSGKSLLSGIILSEILGKPKCLE